MERMTPREKRPSPAYPFILTAPPRFYNEGSMWRCALCRADNDEDDWLTCWSCSSERSTPADPILEPPSRPEVRPRGPSGSGLIRAHIFRALVFQALLMASFLALGLWTSPSFRKLLLEDATWLVTLLFIVFMAVHVLFSPRAIAWNAESLTLVGWAGNLQKVRWSALEGFWFSPWGSHACLKFAGAMSIDLLLSGFRQADRLQFQEIFKEHFRDHETWFWICGEPAFLNRLFGRGRAIEVPKARSTTAADSTQP